MAKQGEIDYLKNIGPDAARMAVGKPWGSPECGRHLMEIGAILSLLPWGAKVLDVGCGTGWTSLFFARNGHPTTGIDIAPDMIEAARQSQQREGIENVHFLLGDYESLSFNAEFDVVVFFDSLHHAMDEQAAVAMAYRALKPGGICLASEPGTGHQDAQAVRDIAQQFNVTEKDMPPVKIRRLGEHAGFRAFRYFPHAFQVLEALYLQPDRNYDRPFVPNGGLSAITNLMGALDHNGITLMVKPSYAPAPVPSAAVTAATAAITAPSAPAAAASSTSKGTGTMSNAPASREELIRAAHAELDQVLHYKPAERIDHLPIGLLDILYAYRLFLGRWPEFDSMETYRQVMGPPHGLWALLTGFLNAPEFKVRIPELAPADMIVMHQLPGGVRLHFNLKDRQSMRIASGIHELEIQQAILSVLKPGMNCVDAGAHIGLYSLLMGRVVGLTGGKVYCFEPFPSTWELLIRNIQENHLEDTILPTNAACHAAPATGRIFEREKEDLGEAYVETEQHAGGGGTQVKLVRVDDIVPANIRIGIIKIDIEGSEPPAMMGMERILKNDRPIIFTEFNPGALESVSRTNPADYLKFLKNHGYRCRQVQHFLAGVNEEYSYAAGDQTTNLVCEPQ